jgi:hypothetical protein
MQKNESNYFTGICHICGCYKQVFTYQCNHIICLNCLFDTNNKIFDLNYPYLHCSKCIDTSAETQDLDLFENDDVSQDLDLFNTDDASQELDLFENDDASQDLDLFNTDDASQGLDLFNTDDFCHVCNEYNFMYNMECNHKVCDDCMMKSMDVCLDNDYQSIDCVKCTNILDPNS